MENRKEKKNDIQENLLDGKKFLAENENNSYSSQCEEGSDNFIKNEIEETASISLKRTGGALATLSFLAVVLSIPLSVRLHLVSAGGGLWCSVFIFFWGILILTSHDLTKSSRTFISFGCGGLLFGFIMIVLELAEITTALYDNLEHSQIAVSLHAILSGIALAEIALTIFAMVLYRKNITEKKKISFKDETEAEKQKMEPC